MFQKLNQFEHFFAINSFKFTNKRFYNKKINYEICKQNRENFHLRNSVIEVSNISSQQSSTSIILINPYNFIEFKTLSHLKHVFILYQNRENWRQKANFCHTKLYQTRTKWARL